MHDTMTHHQIIANEISRIFYYQVMVDRNCSCTVIYNKLPIFLYHGKCFYSFNNYATAYRLSYINTNLNQCNHIVFPYHFGSAFVNNIIHEQNCQLLFENFKQRWESVNINTDAQQLKMDPFLTISSMAFETSWGTVFGFLRGWSASKWWNVEKHRETSIRPTN